MRGNVWESEVTGRAANTTPIANHPAAEEVSMEEFFERNIHPMDQHQLQELDRAGEEIMKRGRVLGAGKAILHLPDEDELERIDRKWKREDEARLWMGEGA